MRLDRRKILSLTGAVALAGVVIVGGIYGPTAWKVLRGQVNMVPSEEVVIQTPPVNSTASGQEATSPSDSATEGQANNPPSAQPEKSTSTPTDQKGNKNTQNLISACSIRRRQ